MTTRLCCLFLRKMRLGFYEVCEREFFLLYFLLFEWMCVGEYKLVSERENWRGSFFFSLDRWFFILLQLILPKLFPLLCERFPHYL
jgi:hypothetical protein